MRHLKLCLTIAALIGSCFVPIAVGQVPGDNPNIKVELIDAGKAPLKNLRYTLAAGSKQSVLTTMKSQNDIFSQGTKVLTQVLPTQRITVDTEITKVGSEGTAEYNLKYADIVLEDDANNPSPQTAAIRSMIQPLIGATGNGAMSNRGISVSSKLNIPEGLNPVLKATIESMQETMGNMSLQFPQEAIGVGGKWRVNMNIKAQGMTISQTLTCELTELNESGATAKCGITQSAEPQDVKSPAFPPGTTVKLLSVDGKGESVQTLVFNSLFPSQSTTKVNTSIDMEVSTGGQTQKLNTKTQVETTVASPAK